MTATGSFRRQHEELEVAAQELLRDLAQDAPPVEPGDLRRKLARFTGKLKLHAAMEDEALYPRRLTHESAEVRQKARELLDDVGTLYSVYFAFTARWLKLGAIEEDATTFAVELVSVLKLLAKRIARENGELYPLVDALEVR